MAAIMSLRLKKYLRAGKLLRWRRNPLIYSESELLAELTPETAHADELAHPMSIQGDRQTGEIKQALAGFGMWKDHASVQDVDICVSEMRKPRGAR